MRKKHLILTICTILCFMIIFTSCRKAKENIVMNQNSTAELTKETAKESSYYELLSPSNEVRNVSSKTVKEIKSNMTYEEIIKKLGMTKDIGSGLFLAQYVVDNKLNLIISFGNFNDKCSLDGDQLLKAAKSL